MILRRLGVILVVLLVAVGTASVLSSCVVIRSSLELPAPSDQARGFVLISHGYGNNPSHWPARLISRIKESYNYSKFWDVYANDWSGNSKRALTAANAGLQIGEALAEHLIESGDPYEVIHLVGHSLGAWVIQGFADEYQKLGGRAVVQMSFLDPFLIRGILGINWGVRYFGRNAHFADNYVVMNEPVFGTNRYLEQAHNFDITEVIPEHLWDEAFGPHWWAVEFYRSSIDRLEPGFSLSPMMLAADFSPGDIEPLLRGLRQIFPPGGVTQMRADRRLAVSR